MKKSTYDHRIKKVNGRPCNAHLSDEAYGAWEISWTKDFRDKQHGKLRNPVTYTRTTDLKGAKAFAKKHGLEWVN